MRSWLLRGALLGVLLLPATAWAEPGEYRLVGSYSQTPDSLRGELVPVQVPWGGVNEKADVLGCFTGPFQIKDNLVSIGGPERLVRLRLKGGLEDDWELVEASGACAGLSGRGDYRLTDTPMFRLNALADFAAPAPADPTPTNTADLPAEPPPSPEPTQPAPAG